MSIFHIKLFKKILCIRVWYISPGRILNPFSLSKCDFYEKGDENEDDDEGTDGSHELSFEGDSDAGEEDTAAWYWTHTHNDKHIRE